ncbi:response regulator [Salinimonas sediminis]|uniref:Response regulator n=1 Tax=Salinimonas sediminis TaxID=2303538 RepID=A0A346NIX5_9ALTE|nr:response regulator [Salinimonas sediminis]
MEIILKPRIVLVEDDDRLRTLVTDFLQEAHYDVTSLEEGSDLVPLVSQHPPELIILDIMLPGLDGFGLCRQLRQFYRGPLLFMTARGDDLDHVMGLEIGADDYITKPVEPRVLLARVQALLRRVGSPPTLAHDSPARLQFGSLVIDKPARSVKLANSPIKLTSHEFDMLWLLACHAGDVVDRNTIYERIIGREYDGLDRSADVRISRLRKKLEDDPGNPFRIKTIWGKGFFFVAEAWD